MVNNKEQICEFILGKETSCILYQDLTIKNIENESSSSICFSTKILATRNIKH
jgi:hypothetical protein